MILIKRAGPLFLALVVVLASVIPVSAAETYYSIIPEQTVSLYVSDSGSSSSWQTVLELPSDVLNMPITLVVDGRSYSGYFSEIDGSYSLGNVYLAISYFPDSGEDFFVGYEPGVRFGISLRGDIKSAVVEVYAGTKSDDGPGADVGLLGDLGSVAGAVMDFVVTIADTIVSSPLLLLTVGFLFCGGCVGIFGRILSKN